MNKWQLRNRIIKRLHVMCDELQQTITDKESWNDNRTDCEPFDVGWDRVMLQCVTKQIEAWEADDMDAVKRWSDKMNGIAERTFG